MAASGTFPPVVQTLTVQWAECPRSLLACALAISTQRLTCAGSGTALAPLCGLVLVLVLAGVGVGVSVTVCVGVGAALAVALGVALAVALAVALEVAGVADGLALAEVLTMARLGVDDVDGLGDAVVLAAAFVVVFAGVEFVAVAAALDCSVPVDVAVASADVAVASADVAVASADVVAEPVGSEVSVGSEVEVSVAVAAGVADGLVEVALGVVGVAGGLVEFGSAVGEVRVGEGDGLDGVAGSCTGSHDSPLVAVAVLAAAVLAATVRLAPEAASRTLPAISVTITGRACVKRMKRPTSTARRGMSPIGYRAPRAAPSALLPGWPL
jgi:hypothetical protein